MSIRFKAIKPGNFDANALYSEIADAANTILRSIRRDFDRTVETWDGDPYYTSQEGENPSSIPEFLEGVWEDKGVINAQVHTDEPLYFFLNDGTDVRYATMTDPFEAKTTPGVIGSGPGRGGLLYVDVNTPRPGIEARKWDRAIAHKHRPLVRRALERGIARGVARSGHEYK
ncbi:MAG: hypothetical protein ACF8NJ_08925 [Phycisphaerales bacterium JB038]